jgi:hypothetical protein
MNLARHFSAGAEGRHEWSPVGTIEFIPKHIYSMWHPLRMDISSRPYGTHLFVFAGPGTEVPG